jgi:Flp pilus assembly protein TadD
VETTPLIRDSGLGRWLDSGMHWDEAIPYLRRIVRAEPRDFQAQLLLGRCYCRVGRYAEAIATYRSAIAAQPSEGVGYAALAEAQELNGERYGALRTLEEGSRSAKTNLAVVERRLGDLRKAVA